jgi:dTDP-4-dehydrorhamnose 3,5-epimerase
VRFEQTQLSGVVVLIPEPYRDERGLFTRTFDAAQFDEWSGTPGASAMFAQDSQSRSIHGVVRGMHGRSGAGEAKLVRCAHGAIHDVVVDIRKDSPTFGEKQAFLLDDSAFHHLYIPAGFLHGFQVLSSVADVCYRISRPHDPTEDVAVSPLDPDLAISWPEPISVISARDANAGSWQELNAHLG